MLSRFSHTKEAGTCPSWSAQLWWLHFQNKSQEISHGRVASLGYSLGGHQQDAHRRMCDRGRVVSTTSSLPPKKFEEARVVPHLLWARPQGRRGPMLAFMHNTEKGQDQQIWWRNSSKPKTHCFTSLVKWWFLEVSWRRVVTKVRPQTCKGSDLQKDSPFQSPAATWYLFSSGRSSEHPHLSKTQNSLKHTTSFLCKPTKKAPSPPPTRKGGHHHVPNHHNRKHLLGGVGNLCRSWSMPQLQHKDYAVKYVSNQTHPAGSRQKAALFPKKF